MSEHLCPVCRVHSVPVWRAMCRWCFDTTPWKVRSEFMNAYRCRVVDQVRYQELLIEVRQWWLAVNSIQEGLGE